MNRPNILLLCADMAGAADFGCYGSVSDITPNIDGLAAAGVLFEQAYCPCPPCIPARVSLMSGLYAHTHGKIAHLKMRPAPQPPLLPELLSRAGYRAGIVGKTHWWPPTATLGCDDTYITIDNHLTPELGKNDAYMQFLESKGLFEYDDDTWEHEKDKLKPDLLPFDCLKANWTARQTCELLATYARNEEPFFLFCSFVEPHGAGKVPSEYLEKIDAATLPPIIERNGEHEDKPRIQRRAVERWTVERDAKETYRREVYAGIGLVDQNVGKILDTVRELGLAENTAVVFLTDHGDLMYDHGCIEKTFLYEQAIRIPFLISGPGIPSGERRKHLVSQIDLLPTILDLCDIEVDSLRIEGRSVLPIIRNPGVDWRTRLYAEVDQTVHLKGLVSSASAKMVREGSWKYIYTLVEGHVVEEELYDLDEDPDELFNKAGLPAHRERLRAFQADILRWLVATEVNRSHPAPENHYPVPSIDKRFF